MFVTFLEIEGNAAYPIFTANMYALPSAGEFVELQNKEGRQVYRVASHLWYLQQDCGAIAVDVAVVKMPKQTEGEIDLRPWSKKG